MTSKKTVLEFIEDIISNWSLSDVVNDLEYHVLNVLDEILLYCINYQENCAYDPPCGLGQCLDDNCFNKQKRHPERILDEIDQILRS